MTAEPDAAATSLADAVREVERHVATAGWDAPVRVFALVRTAAALAASPELAGQLPAEVVAAARRDPEHLTSVEQEGLPQVDSIEGLLGSITWPPTVHGCAVVVERVTLPEQAQGDLPEDAAAASAYVLAHPQRQDVRIAVGVLRDSGSWCAVRSRTADDDSAVLTGPDLVPGLVAAVRDTLS